MLTGYILAVVNDPPSALAEIDAPPGILVIARSSIEEAIQIASYVIPKVVLTAHSLPDGSGLDLLLALKRHPSLEDVPVVLLGMQDLLYYQRLGVRYYLPSHLEAGQLSQLLAQILKQSSVSHPPIPVKADATALPHLACSALGG